MLEAKQLISSAYIAALQQAVSRVLSDGDEDCERVGVDGCDGIRRMMRQQQQQQQQLLLWQEMERQSREEVESIKTKFLAIAAVTWLIWLLFYMPLSQLDLL